MVRAAGCLRDLLDMKKHPSQEYIALADCGELYDIEDSVYSLFLVIEIIVYKELSSVLFVNKGAHIEKVK